MLIKIQTGVEVTGKDTFRRCYMYVRPEDIKIIGRQGCYPHRPFIGLYNPDRGEPVIYIEDDVEAIAKILNDGEKFLNE